MREKGLGEGALSRKQLFAGLAEPKPGEGGTSAESLRQRQRVRPILGSADGSGVDAAPVGAIGRSLDAAAQRGRRAEELEKRLAEGLTVVELDTAVVDPSFISDRMPSPPEAQASLLEAIRDNGQQVPILVRPHPKAPERFQVAYGHRRLRAASDLGRPVRAVVRDLSDEELAVAQGQENNERRDLSYVEKARFARGLEERFGRKTVMAALSLYKSDLSNMLSVVSRIPPEIVEAIGPAPAVGRRGWIGLADAIAKKGALASVEKAVTGKDFPATSSDDRFKAALAAATPKASGAKAKALHDAGRREIGRLAATGAKVVLTIDRRKAPRFADFVVGRLQDLYMEFEAGSDRP